MTPSLSAQQRSALAPARLRAIRTVFCDLDETLLNPDYRVGDRSKHLVHSLTARGIEFVVCTGRAPETTRPIVKELGTRYYICCNGAATWDDRRLLADNTIRPGLTGNIVEFFDCQGCPTFFMTPDGYFVSRITPLVEQVNRKRGVPARLATHSDWYQPAHKIMPWQAAHLYDGAMALWSGRIDLVYHHDYFEITPTGVSKAAAARKLAAMLGLLPEQVAAVGDARNDLELIAWAGVGAAMGNADELVKRQADVVLGHHAEDGAAELFEAILAAHGEP